MSALGIPPGWLAALAVDRIPLGRSAALALGIPPGWSAELAVGQIPRALSAALALGILLARLAASDAATASGCCASRRGARGILLFSDKHPGQLLRAGCLTVDLIDGLSCRDAGNDNRGGDND